MLYYNDNVLLACSELALACYCAMSDIVSRSLVCHLQGSRTTTVTGRSHGTSGSSLQGRGRGLPISVPTDSSLY